MSNQVAERDHRNSVGAESAHIEALASRFRQGDEDAFDELVNACQSRIFNLAYRMLNNYHDAAELTQDVFVKVYRSIGKFRGKSKFSTWLYAVAANSCRNRLRRTRRISLHEVRSLDETTENGRPLMAERATAPGPNPAEAHGTSETMKVVAASIAGLPQGFGAVIVMKDVQGMAYEEIAAALGCSLGTVKSRLSRARNMVKQKLQRMGIRP